MLEMARSSWLCAPQALHPFYPGRGRRVGACWMTRWQRELAIEQNLDYIGKVLAAVRAQAGLPGGPLFLAGFSQAWGWCTGWPVSSACGGWPGHCVWAGIFPPSLPRRSCVRCLRYCWRADGWIKIYNQQAFDARPGSGGPGRPVLVRHAVRRRPRVERRLCGQRQCFCDHLPGRRKIIGALAMIKVKIPRLVNQSRGIFIFARQNLCSILFTKASAPSGRRCSGGWRCL